MKCSTKVYIRATIDETPAGNRAWELIESGEARALSIASNDGSKCKKRGVVDGVTYWDRWVMSEVSVCREGANPDCHLEIFKS